MGINDLEKLMLEHPERCDQCGGILEYRGIGCYRCMSCGNEMLDDYGKIKKYFETHGPTSVLQISKETGLSRDKLKILLKRGTAEIPINSAFSLNCEMCGAAIRYGRYCTKCANSCFGEEIGERFKPQKSALGRSNFGNYSRNK